VETLGQSAQILRSQTQIACSWADFHIGEPAKARMLVES
jgi:hypothetical protein